ncbi:MAG TPA: hypothetical protein VII54_02110 [Gaiellaceae bacterium]|jgi:hypothetical protein
MPAKTIKKLLLSLIVMGILGSFTAGGTYALLTGQGSNPNNSIASGSLLMDNTVGAGSACHSQSGALNINTTCDTLFTSGLLYPIPSAAEPPLPASTTYAFANVTIKNSGTLPETFKIYMPSCTYAVNGSFPAVSWAAINPCCPGTASGALPAGPCTSGSLDFIVQEYTSSAFTTALSACVWPVSIAAACTFQADSFGSFWSGHHDNTHYLSLGSTPLAAGSSRYFQIAVAEPTAAANGLQGQTATFSLYWHAE